MSIQTNYPIPSIKQLGFTLIEAMVAFAVAGVGILAVVSFQTELISSSSESKARAEALQLAQTKLEEFKNYTFSTAADFSASTTYADINDSNTSNDESDIPGTNATFDRDYTIDTTDGLKIIAVTVSWTDAKSNAQDVTLYTSLTFQTQTVIAAENIAAPPTVASATGTATIGDGTADCSGGDCSNNGDGTSIIEDGDDLKLVINEGNGATEKVVLTLSDACVSGTCTQFVQISGNVYVDNTTQTSLNGYDVNVLASDAAYCQRYYLSTGGSLATAIAADASIVTNTASNVTTYYLDDGATAGQYDADDTALTATLVDTNSSTATPSTANDDYNYFRYTCYLGGGWHGNIGILLVGGNDDDDKFCLGDPTSAITEDQPVIAARRVYRGMSYKTASSGTTETLTLDDLTTITVEGYTLAGGTTDVKYYSQGIIDAAQINGQDFVIGYDSHPNTAYSDLCTTADGEGTAVYPFDTATNSRGYMTRTDSDSGNLFAGIPADFYCLNEEALIAAEGDFGYKSSCPYNPASPPNSVYEISGAITVTSANSALVSGALIHTDPDTSVATDVNLVIENSQSIGNCTQTAYTGSSGVYSLTYSCNVYDWSDDAITGWAGNILSSSDLATGNFSCTTPITIALRTSDLAGQDVSCDEILPYDIGGDIMVAATSLTTDGGTTNKLYETGTDINFAVNSSLGDNCTVNPFTGTSGGGIYYSSYSCTVWPWETASVWSWSGDILASSDSVSVSCTTPTFSAITADDLNGDMTCNGVEQIIISGTSNGLTQLAAVTITGGSCTVAADQASYECTTYTPENTAWSGTVQFDVGTKYVCHDSIELAVDTSTTSVATTFDTTTDTATYSGLSGGTYGNEDIQIENNVNGCP